ncbi:MAG: hypothetical protein JW768_00315 [Chitinispirillaceae bacterium]|nr:hypothetical protein [Chitinispirillaceae bacterium]
MNFNPAGYLFSAALLLHACCAIDPVQVDTNRTPHELTTFGSHGISWMAPVESNRFYAASNYRLFMIDTDAADSTGNIVQQVSSLITPPACLFGSETGDPVLATYGGFYRIDTAGLLVAEYEFQNPYHLYEYTLTVDWKGQCRYIRRFGGSKLGIYAYKAGFEYTVIDSCVDQDSIRYLRFAAADDRCAVSLVNSSYETRILLYKRGIAQREIGLFENEDSAYVQRLFYVGSELQMMCHLEKSLVIETKDQEKKTVDRGTNFISLDSNGICSVKTRLSLRASPGYYNKMFYRSSRETWLWDQDSWLVATPDSIVQHLFRQGEINRFNVLCFRDSSEVLFYDEATQRFISRN